MRRCPVNNGGEESWSEVSELQPVQIPRAQTIDAGLVTDTHLGRFGKWQGGLGWHGTETGGTTQSCGEQSEFRHSTQNGRRRQSAAVRTGNPD